MKESQYKWRKVSTSEGKCVLVEVGALTSWCIYSYRIVKLLVPYMWASMTFLPILKHRSKVCPCPRRQISSSEFDRRDERSKIAGIWHVRFRWLNFVVILQKSLVVISDRGWDSKRRVHKIRTLRAVVPFSYLRGVIKLPSASLALHTKPRNFFTRKMEEKCGFSTDG